MVVQDLISVLTKKEKRKFTLIIILSFVTGLIDTLGIASIMPLIAILTNPELIETNQVLRTIYEKSLYLGVKDKESFKAALIWLVLIVLVVSLIIKSLSSYAQLKFAMILEYSISSRLLSDYLNAPYNWYKKINTAKIGNKILSEVSVIITKGFMPLMMVITQVFLTALIIILLLTINITIAMVAGTMLILVYALLMYATRKKLETISKKRVEENENRFKYVIEAFNDVKLLKLNHTEDWHIGKFKKSARKYAEYNSLANIISILPRYIVEGVAFTGMLLIMLYMTKKGNQLIEILPLITLYAFAGYRLIPAIQQVYGGITQLRFATQAIKQISSELRKIRQLRPKIFQVNKNVLMNFKEKISLDNVSFKYDDSSRRVLRNINLNINANNIIGVIGMSGSGKTTFVDLIMGLNIQETGKIKIDGTELFSGNVRHWQKNIGYVPQDIYLSDDTVKSNIAYGVNEEKIDMDMVRLASKRANINSFIEHELEDKYETKIGEKGQRLSGGQKQRLAIARALYKNPNLLILDEATNALDTKTEDGILKTLVELSKNTTIIIIAHREDILKDADIILRFDDGNIEVRGNNHN